MTLVAAGDNLIHDVIWMQASRRAGGNGYDFAPAYEAIAPIVAEADFAFVNQETVLAGAELPLSNYPRFCSPPEVGETMLPTTIASTREKPGCGCPRSSGTAIRKLLLPEAMPMPPTGTASL